MRLLFDESLSEALVDILGDLFPESVHVRQIGADGAEDSAVWALARERDCLLVTKDEDFHRLSVLRGAPPAGWPRQVVVSEGVPDFLTWATHYGDAAEDAPALIGVISGSWSLELAATIPDGSRVIVRTHHDKAGDTYAETIRASLARRCKVLRSQIPENVDT